jgi:hypothetical protein
MSSDSSSETDSSKPKPHTSEYEDPIPLVRRNYENRLAAARIRNQLRQNQPKTAPISTELGDLPDVEGLSIQNTPLSAYNQKPSRDMSKSVTFSGKPSQLDSFLTHVDVKILADGTTTEAQKCGTLASHLRGPALDWLTRELGTNPRFLSDYDELKAQLKKAFAISDDAKQLQAANNIASLYQKGSVTDYAQRFNTLATEAGLNTQAKTALFQKGLKPHIRRALIISDGFSDYGSCVAEATRIDTNLFYAESHKAKGKKPKGHGPKRGKDGKYVKQEEF